MYEELRTNRRTTCALSVRKTHLQGNLELLFEKSFTNAESLH